MYIMRLFSKSDGRSGGGPISTHREKKHSNLDIKILRDNEKLMFRENGRRYHKDTVKEY